MKYKCESENESGPDFRLTDEHGETRTFHACREYEKMLEDAKMGSDNNFYCLDCYNKRNENNDM